MTKAIQVHELGGKAMFRRKAVGEVDHRKAALRKAHTVKSVSLLIAVDKSASVNTDDRRERFLRACRIIDVQDLLRMGPVGQVFYLDHILWLRQSLVADLIVFLKQLPHPLCIDIFRSRSLSRPLRAAKRRSRCTHDIF